MKSVVIQTIYEIKMWKAKKFTRIILNIQLKGHTVMYY